MKFFAKYGLSTRSKARENPALFQLQGDVVGTDIGIRAVIAAKTALDGAERQKADPFIQVPCREIGRYNGIKLQNFKSETPCLFHTVKHQLFTDMHAAAFGRDGVAGVGNVSAATDVVGVQNV